MEPVLPRGCGKRKAGGVYSMCPTGPGGKEVEEFLFCSPHSLPIDWHDPPRVSFPAIGVQLITGPDGVCHIVDWVGSEHYPNVADFIEEVRRLGMSRRLPPSAAILSKLTAGSRHLLIHARARVRNMGDLLAAANWEGDRYLGNPRAARNHSGCPRQVAWHFEDLQGDPTESEPCLGAAWEVVEGGEDPETPAGPALKGSASCAFPVYRLAEGETIEQAMSSTASEHLADLHAAPRETFVPRLVRRRFPEDADVPTFFYFGRSAPDGFEVEHEPGIFASFPISHLEVVDGGDEDETAAAFDALKECGLRWEVCPE